jgi:hypothetical protein
VRKRQLSYAEATASALQIYRADEKFMLGLEKWLLTMRLIFANIIMVSYNL